MEHGKAKNGIRFNSVITLALKHLTFPHPPPPPRKSITLIWINHFFL